MTSFCYKSAGLIDLIIVVFPEMMINIAPMNNSERRYRKYVENGRRFKGGLRG